MEHFLIHLPFQGIFLPLNNNKKMLNNLEGSPTWHLKTNLVLVGC